MGRNDVNIFDADGNEVDIVNRMREDDRIPWTREEMLSSLDDWHHYNVLGEDD